MTAERRNPKVLTNTFYTKQYKYMKNLIWIIISLVSLKLFAADSFSGHWVGKGFLTFEGYDSAVSINMDITLLQSMTAFTIHDCWETTAGTSCYDSNYELNDASQINEEGRKIGDIYPHDVLIYNGNAQVSEQMIFHLNQKNELRYRYTYTNMDGGMQTRYGVLQQKVDLK